MGIVLMMLLLGGSLLTAAVGISLLTDATTGVGVIGVALLMGVYARIAQASFQHRTQESIARKLIDKPKPPELQ